MDTVMIECPTAFPILAEALAAHVTANAPRYFPGSAEPVAPARLVRSEVRSYSRLYRFEISLGGQRHMMLVKVPTAAARNRSGTWPEQVADRPRIVPVVDPQRKSILEFHALSRIHDHFRQRNDSRFGAVQVFELLLPYHGIVMEAVDQPALRQLVIESGRGYLRRDRELCEVFRNAGAWLHSYHSLPTSEPLKALHQRADFLRFTEEHTRCLTDLLGDERYFSGVNSAIAARACDSLPDVLPLGLAHGDYAMRNILVGPEQRVTVLDSLARYNAPVYRDLACFLTDLSYSCLAAVGRGAFAYPARVADYREAFLGGYFDSTAPPKDAIRLFEVQALLERWCSVVWSRSVHKRPMDRMQMLFLSAFFRKLIQSRLR